MPDIFISYSRKDKTFVRRLHAALAERGFDIWVDFEDIPLTADWWKEIQQGIESSNAFVFVISPDSVVSPYTRDEIQYAVELNKHFVPVLYRPYEGQVDPNDVHPSIGLYNWVFFREEDDFETSLQALVDAVTTDLDYLRTHTRLLVRAREWEERARENSLLLDGIEIYEAEKWLEAAQNKQPEPTPLHIEYIHASRAYERAMRRRWIIGTSITLVVLGLAVLSFWLFTQANNNLQLANVRGTQVAQQAATAESALELALIRGTEVAQQALISEVNLREAQSAQALLAASKSGEMLAAGQDELALLLALEAFENYPEIYRVEAQQALLNALNRSTHVVAALTSEEPPGGARWNNNGNRLLVWAGTDAVIYDVDGAEPIQLTHNGDVLGGIWSPDGAHLLTWASDQFAYYWSPDGTLLTDLKHEATIDGAAWSADGAHFVTWSRDSSATIWDAEGGFVAELLHNDWVRGAGWSPDGQTLLTWSLDGRARLWNATGRRLQTLFHDAPVLGAGWSPDGAHIFTWSNAPTRCQENCANVLNIWRSSGQLTISMPYEQPIAGAVWSPDGAQILVWSGHNLQVRGLDGAIGAELTLEADAGGALWLDDGAIISWGLDNVLLRWEPAIGEIWRLEMAARIANVRPDASNEMLLVRAGEQAVIVATNSGTPWSILPHERTLQGAGWSTDGEYIYTRTSGRTLRIWDTLNPVQTVLPLRSIPQQALWSPDGAFALTLSRAGVAELWTLDGELVFDLPLSQVIGVRWHESDNQFLTWSLDGEIQIRDTEGNLLLDVTARALPENVIWSPDSSYLLAYGDREAWVWRVDDGVLIANVEHDDVVNGAAWSPDGAAVLSWSDAGAALWNVTGEVQANMAATGLILGAAWSPDGTKIFTWSADGSIALWNTAGDAVQTAMRQTPITGAAWSPDSVSILLWAGQGAALLNADGE
ncbi:MAG: toll/interleukin-1 receptor domain-containing protein, partial [Chloroflexi bacterium]